ncbi:DUF3000 domain-containing protein [Helcobacillus massiliensis]|uniref:DUF3000 family protein n=1 Tax=Helcobacillus massiliensis TaxID=521392 RepID=A0A839QYV7_9MICO|nr:DUF3000 domain-containing protein [Helcobacillus massiliensis]MBB3022587.1 hypothetical protein [Helcobacillus massiliensis]MCT1557221.1 DUF3000 domain-containing protein [Helcobacillus massiliensis]MCT2036929.1 DUF3000 domain-containing protein [Helcobacillus massiliensis]MCT2332681.1 DUF3000 domain-containing protein [Helcobacillus massiliensis]MDK7742860.1 DUF3000 domain-containing protein [Helcobacillus massiliensis]
MAVHQFPQHRAAFQALTDALSRVRVRREVEWNEIPAPSRLAPFTWAASAELIGDDDEEVASGKFIVLYDPAGNDSWQGDLRVVTLMQARLEPEFAVESMLGDVAWSWVTESLESMGASAHELGCTITRVVSQSYGALAARPTSVDVEIRASWTPDEHHLEPHFASWTQILAAAGGLPPRPVDLASARPPLRADDL